MRIAVIGHIKGFGCGSIAYRIIEVLEKLGHIVVRIPTQTLSTLNIEGKKEVYKISKLLGDIRNHIDFIIVTQSHIYIRNDTDIPLILMKTERVDPYGTVINPTTLIKKLEVKSDLVNYKNIAYVTIDLKRYNPDREKELVLCDAQWQGLAFEGYIDRMERSKYAIIYQRVHETDCITTRAIEAMACKTIPIVFYHTPDLIELYGMMGINNTNAYFICTSQPWDLELPEYDIKMANKGYELVHKYYGTEVLVAKILSFIEKEEMIPIVI